MRVLVTGASGVFGTDLCTRLHWAGHEVVGLARHRPDHLPQIDFVAGDIRDPAAVEKAMVGCDVVAHLAWAVTPLKSAADTREVNVGGTVNVLEAMNRTGCRRVVFSSSCLAYGSHPDNPEFLAEADPLRPDPQILYAFHKSECEALVAAASVESVITRTAVVMGRDIDNYALRLFSAPALMTIKGDAPRWQFIHQEDVGRFHVLACDGEQTGIVNVAAPDVISHAEMAELVHRPMARASVKTVTRVLEFTWKHDLVEFNPDDLAGMRWMPVMDTTRMRDEWNFECAWTGREALADVGRVMERTAYLGKVRLEKPWRMPWVDAWIPTDVPPHDGGPLVAAAPDGVAGELDCRIDPRFSTFTAANVSEAFPGPMTPLSLELTQHVLRGSAVGTVSFIGLAEPLRTELIARATPAFGHRIYANVSVLREMAKNMPGWTPEDIEAQYLGVPKPEGPAPKPTLKEIARTLRLVARVAPMAAGYKREVDHLLAEVERTVLPGGAADVQALADARLTARIRLLHDLVVNAWNVSTNSNILAGGVLGAIEKIGGAEVVGSLRGGISGFASAGALLGVDRLVVAARRSEEVEALLRERPPAEALLALRDVAPSFVAELDGVIAEFGHRGPGETELANAVFADDPAMLLDAVAKSLSVPPRTAPQTPHTSRVVRALSGAATRSLQLRERARDAVVRLNHELRLAVRERGRRLADAGVLDAADDIFYLSFDEVLGAPPGVGGVVAGRRAERARLAALEVPALIEGSWAPLSREVRPLADGETLSGLPASAGVACGAVRVLSEANLDTLLPGEVLVARVTDTGWTPMFAYAAAVVVEIGALASHPAIVAREYGIPCVVGVADAMSRLTDGQFVEVDGGKGTVRLADPASS